MTPCVDGKIFDKSWMPGKNCLFITSMGELKPNHVGLYSFHFFDRDFFDFPHALWFFQIFIFLPNLPWDRVNAVHFRSTCCKMKYHLLPKIGADTAENGPQMNVLPKNR